MLKIDLHGSRFTYDTRAVVLFYFECSIVLKTLEKKVKQKCKGFSEIFTKTTDKTDTDS